MKRKHYFATLMLILLSVYSCSNDEDIILNDNQNDTSFLRFKNNKEIQDKINDLTNAFNLKESALIEKLLTRNKLSNPTIETKTGNLNLNEKTIKDDVMFYHSERLKAIYDLRKSAGFTSIKSIADEINSLMAIDQEKAYQLFNENEEYLIKSHYLVSTIFNEDMSYVINSKGQIMFDNQFLDVTSNIDMKNTCSKEGILTSKVITGSTEYTITWHAGSERTSGFFNPNDYTVYAKLGSFIDFGNGPILQPTWFYTNPNAIAYFWSGITTTINFPVSAGNIISNEYDTNSYTCVLNGSIPHSTFVTVLGGQFITTTGSTSF